MAAYCDHSRTEEDRCAVFLMALLLSRQIEKRGYCSVVLALLCQSASEVVWDRVRIERLGASGFEPRLGHLYLSEASSR
jgi:hypothetical protein